MMKKKNIAIVAGGDSGEYEISINSASVVKKNLNKDIYNTYIIHIKGVEWTYQSDDVEVIPVDKNDFSIILNGEKIIFDCVFNAIHGTPGEDGKLQGYLELLKIPYTSCDQFTSSLTFNKFFCNKFVSSLGIDLASSWLITKENFKNNNELPDDISFPCFVKPNKGGSSVGISKVNEKKYLQKAIEIAFKEDDEVLVEEFIDGIEITCGLFMTNGKLTILPLTEVVSKNEFFDYEAKYTSGMADEITPARVSEKVENECKILSAFLYNQFNCKGIVRIDFIYSNEKLYFLEVNTVPGFSENSIVPQQAEEMGISLKELFGMTIEEALITEI